MKKENSTVAQDIWKQRLRMTQQLIFGGIRKIADHSDCVQLKQVMSRQWFAGFDMNLSRMLPDGTTAVGAPTNADLCIRNEVVNAVVDGLKQRPRDGNRIARSLFKLEMYEYDLIHALTDMYFKTEEFVRQDQIDNYAASALETTVYAMLHVARAEDLTEVFKPFDEQDFEACSI